ncbi:MAG: DUF5717 family protein [Lachnospiraceae bacterium]
MTVAFKSVLEQMAAGELEHVYAQAVISVDKEEIIWDGSGKRNGSIAVYSRNDVEPVGTVQSLHPALIMKENSFQGNTTLHYELIPGRVFSREEWSTDGILLCYNGGEYVIPLHFKVPEEKLNSEEKNSVKNNPEEISKDGDRTPVRKGFPENIRREKEEIIRLTKLNLERIILSRRGEIQEKQTELLKQITAGIQFLVRLRPDCIRYKIYEALAALENGNSAYAAKLERRIRNVIVSARKQHCIEYCMLLNLQYGISLAQNQMREAGVRKQQLGSYIQMALDKEPEDQDLVLLLCGGCLQLADRDPVNLWEELQQLYQRGNNSPYLFFYGALLLEDSRMERILDAGIDGWTGRCLQTGIKKQLISKKTAESVSLCRPELYTTYICSMYEKMYAQYPSREMLSALCTVMIRSDKKGSRAFPIYEQAVEEGMKIARLFDYYMCTLPSGYEKPVNREVLLYFSLDELVNPQIYTKLLLNVLQFYTEDPQIYNHYTRNMQDFVRNQIMRSCWSEDLALLAGEVITPDMLDRELAQALIPMLYLVQVKAQVPDGYQVVFESGIFKEPQTGVFVNGKACLCVPGGNGRFHLQDRRGKRISGMNLKVCPLMQDEQLMECCEKLCPDDDTLLLMKTHARILQRDFSSCDFRLGIRYLKDDSLDDDFRKKLLDFILEDKSGRCFENSDIHAVCTCSDLMDGNQMASFTEILIRRKYYTEAAGFLSGLSRESVDDGLLLELAGALARYPENETSVELMNLLTYLFQKGILDDFLLLYLARNCQGKKELIEDLYTVCRDRKLNCEELKLNLLLRLLLLPSSDMDLFQEVFVSVVDLEQAELLLQAAINRICHEYLCGSSEMEADVMAALQSMVIHSGSISDLTVPCQLACLRYDQEAGLDHEIEHMLLKEMCRNMITLGMTLDFVQKEAAQYGLSVYPVLSVNLSSAGAFHEDLTDKVQKKQESIWAEYYVDEEPETRYRAEAYQVYSCLYSAGIVMFSGERICYRFHCGEQVTAWESMAGWDYTAGNHDDPADCEDTESGKTAGRYDMLQEIAFCLNNGKTAEEKMRHYEKMLKLVDSVGE